MKKYLPILQWIKGYRKDQLSGDIPAGLTVGIMLIPQGMAYAMIAGLPPVYGLYAALVPQVIYAIFGTSRQLAVGPVAMDSLLVAMGLSVISQAGTEYYILMAITLAFLMGIIQLAMGLFRLGFLVNFLSKPVISGFTSAAAIIIGFNQLKHLIGVDIIRSNQVHLLLLDAIQKVESIHWITLIIGVGGIVMIRIIKKFIPKIPAALMVVIAGISAVILFDLTGTGVKIVGDIPTGFPAFSVPIFPLDQLNDLIPIALTLSLIAFMEAISVAKAVEQKHADYKIDANQELIGLGMANIIGSFFQAYPTTGGFSRTAVNDQAGAKTGVSALISAAIVGLTLLFLTPLFYNLPQAVLASIIMVAVFGLIDFKYPLRLWKNRKEEFALLLFTFIITLMVGIKEGIILGVLASLLMLVYRTTKPHLAVLGNIPQTSLFKNIKRFPEATQREDVLIVRFDAQLYFANASYFREALEEEIQKKEGDLKLLIISAEAINFIDSSANHMLLRLIDEIQQKGIQVYVAAAIGPVRDIFQKGGIKDLISCQHMFNTVKEALTWFDNLQTEPEHERLLSIATQSNVKLVQ
ncbi:SulP family inorganic anion transporter [Flexithrix dorotheae]|uniref:SulP family inorganic anion transporter n=1 Tax=Flexithrix dorotheae TaxID=70993 RepID=UPI0003804C59|nr:solute carrier family 26 protein [Flexithrix dorotheae]